MSSFADLVAQAEAFLAPYGLRLSHAISIALVAIFIPFVMLSKPKNSPPWVSCWLPWIGSIVSFGQHPIAFIRQQRDQLGDIFCMRLLGNDMTVVCGKEANQVFFKATDAQLDPKPVYGFMRPVFGPGIVYDAPRQRFQDQLRIAKAAVVTDKLRSYCPLLVEETNRFFDKWEKAGTLDLLDAMGSLTISTASRCLMGKEVCEQLGSGTQRDRISHLYHELESGVNPINTFLPNLPLPGARIRDRARAEIGEVFGKIVADRRKSGKRGNDMLQVFIEAEYTDGSRMTDEEIVGLFVALLFAGQHTSSITSTWLGLNVYSNPDVLERLREEQKEVLARHDGVLTFEAISEMKLLDRCVKETLRMYPPLIMLMRKVMRETTYKGYVIPKGHLIAASTAVTHRLPEIYSNPDTFDPDRFSPEREEDVKAGRYTFIGFGGGRHGCLGENFAYLQIKCIYSTILRNFDLELVDKMPQPDVTKMVVGPTQPCRVKFNRLAQPIA